MWQKIRGCEALQVDRQCQPLSAAAFSLALAASKPLQCSVGQHDPRLRGTAPRAHGGGGLIVAKSLAAAPVFFFGAPPFYFSRLGPVKTTGTCDGGGYSLPPLPCRHWVLQACRRWGL